MQSTLSSLLALTLGTHAVLGCCWHFDMDCRQGAACAFGQAAAWHGESGATAACHQRHEGDDGSPAPQPPCKHRGQGSCLYWCGPRPFGDGGSPAIDPSPLLAFSQFHRSHLYLQPRPVDSLLPLARPLRLHLLQRVLLI